MSVTIPYSKSLLLVWQIAGLEAKNLNQRCLRPAHLLLGILKIVDVDLDKLLETQDPSTVREIKGEVLLLKRSLSEFVLDTTLTRRFLRGILPIGEEKGGTELTSPSRTDEARSLFRSAEQLAKKANKPVYPVHLLYALLGSNELQILTMFEKFGIDANGFKKYMNDFLK